MDPATLAILAPLALGVVKWGAVSLVGWIAARHHSATVQTVAQAGAQTAQVAATAAAQAAIGALQAGASGKQAGIDAAAAAKQAAMQGAIQGVAALANAAAQAQTRPDPAVMGPPLPPTSAGG